MSLCRTPARVNSIRRPRSTPGVNLQADVADDLATDEGWWLRPTIAERGHIGVTDSPVQANSRRHLVDR